MYQNAHVCVCGVHWHLKFVLICTAHGVGKATCVGISYSHFLHTVRGERLLCKIAHCCSLLLVEKIGFSSIVLEEFNKSLLFWVGKKQPQPKPDMWIFGNTNHLISFYFQSVFFLMLSHICGFFRSWYAFRSQILVFRSTKVKDWASSLVTDSKHFTKKFS